ncbi:MAG: hypothetical protein ABI821_12315 [Pseudomonadota bacterium]
MGPPRVSTIETHFAWVFLAGSLAYKLKKPARQAGMDYRSLAARERGCRQELALNRRLAPGVYLSVLPLTVQRGQLRLGGQGTVVDWLVKMRRLPATGMLESRMRRARIAGETLEPLAALLAGFYRRASRAPLDPRRYVARIRGQILANRRALRRLGRQIDQDLVTRVTDAQREFLRLAGNLIGARGTRVVDGHGDLRGEHVCLFPLAVIDCLEFDRRLRLLDPHEDLALLALEIERKRRPDLARHLLDRVGALSGDPPSQELTHLYMSHRATTRAKLSAWHVGDPQFPAVAPWLARTVSYLRSAERHAAHALEFSSSCRGEPL